MTTPKILLLDIEPWELTPLKEKGYEINQQGHVYGARGRALTPRVNSIGYIAVRLRSGWKPLHRLLAETFIPNPKNLETVNHKDGNKLNNKLSNLEWMTRKENLHHAMDNDLHNWGRQAVKKTHIITGKTKTYKSMTDTINDGHIQGNVSNCIRGKRRTHHLYTWELV